MNHTHNTPANGGQILTDERIKSLYEAHMKSRALLDVSDFARDIEAAAFSDRPISGQEERACRAEDALAALVSQVRKTKPVDDHGHNLNMNMAYIKAVELLDALFRAGDIDCTDYRPDLRAFLAAVPVSEPVAYLVDWHDIGEGAGKSCFYDADAKQHMESAVSYALHARTRPSTVTPLYAAAPAPVSGMPESDKERILWCIRTVRAIADLGRAEPLGDWYPQAVMVCGALKRVLDIGDAEAAVLGLDSQSPALNSVSGMPDLAALDAAFEKEIKRISTLKYNSNEICREFYKNLRAAIHAPATPVAPGGFTDDQGAAIHARAVKFAEDDFAATLPAAPAPTEQEAIGVFAIEVEKMLCAALGREWSVCGISIESLIAALAARQAPTEAPKEAITGGRIDNPEDAQFYRFWYSHMQRDQMTGALADINHSTARYIWDAARQAPDSRDAALEQAAKIAMDGPLLTSAGESLYFNDNCKAMALMVANRIRALKGPAQ